MDRGDLVSWPRDILLSRATSKPRSFRYRERPRAVREVVQFLTLGLLQLESYIRKITPVVQQLQEDFPDLKYDKRSVAQLVADVLQFMENALGAQARHLPEFMNSKLRNPEQCQLGPLHIAGSATAETIPQAAQEALQKL